jgi:hypothetical protein
VPTSRRGARVRGQRGIALLSVIALMLIFVIFVGLAVIEMTRDVTNVHNEGVSNRALVAADAGVRAMVVAIEEAISTGNAVPPSVSYSFPEMLGSPSVSYTASIANNWSPLAAKGGPTYFRYYLISAHGQVNNGLGVMTRTVNVIIRAQSDAGIADASTFGVNQWGVPVWYTPDQQINGPVYEGGPMHVDYDDKSTNPIFLSTVQTPNTPVWNDVQGGTTPTTGADWSSIISAGSSAFSIGGNPIALPNPASNLIVASEAFEGDPNLGGFPTAAQCPAVCMNGGPAESGGGALNSGIFINAKATIGAASSGSTETFTITGGFPTYTIKVDFSANTTTVTKGSSSVTYSGVPSGDSSGGGNGAIYINGDATVKLGSVFQGDYVIAVPDFSGFKNKITLGGSGSLLYSNSAKDLLGLWANDIVLNTTSSNVVIDASMIAGWPGEINTDGGLYNAKCAPSGCGVDQGTLTINGALMQNMRGAVGHFTSLTPPIHTGFSRDINYDFRLAGSPPPFFPVTGSYGIVAWDDQGQ